MNFTQSVGKLDKGIGKVSDWAAVISGILLAGMTVLTAVTVTGRYLFSAPVRGAGEILSLTLPALVFLALAVVEKKDEHITVTILSSRFSPGIQLLVKCGGRILAAGITALLTWRLLTFAYSNWIEGTRSLIWDIPIWLVLLVMAVGAAITVLAFSSSLVHYLKDLAKTSRRLLPWILPVFAVVVLVLIAPSGLELGVSRLGLGLIGLLMMILVLLLGVPIAIVLLVVGYIGTSQITGLNSALNVIAMRSYITATNFTWLVLPLFIYMGNLVSQSGFARDIYHTAHKWLGHLPGGIAMATVGGCAGFAAACGDSMSTAVTMGRVALPEMRRYKYDSKLATGTLAAGGTLGILIPPSLGFIVYGLITEQPIGKLFIAGILPGIMLAIMFMALIYIRVRRNPSLALTSPGVGIREKLVSLRLSLPILALFLLVIGGLYGGLFTPGEAGGIGAFGALLIALLMRRWTWKGLTTAVSDSLRLNGAVFFIMIGAMVLGHFVSVSKLPIEVSNLLIASPLGKWGVFGGILLMYVILGCIMTIMQAMIITLPMLFPTVLALGFDPIWFGVIMVITMEMGQITPPVGINVFAIAGVARDIPMATIFRGIFPFLLLMLAAIGILMVFPQIATFLPSLG